MKNMKQSQSTTELFLNDFQVQNWELDSKVKENLSKKSSIIFFLFSLDLIICHILIGQSQFFLKNVKTNQFLGPAVVAFWRGTWDFGNLWYCVNEWHVILLSNNFASGLTKYYSRRTTIWAMLLPYSPELLSTLLLTCFTRQSVTLLGLPEVGDTCLWGTCTVLSMVCWTSCCGRESGMDMITMLAMDLCKLSSHCHLASLHSH